MNAGPLPNPTFFFSSPDGPVPFDSDTLSASLPLAKPGGAAAAAPAITYRAYLDSVGRFIQGHWARLLASLSEDGLVREDEITGIDVIAEKHGSDYHPARVRIHGEGRTVSLVVNAALTDRGKSRVEREFLILKDLCVVRQRRFVPKVYLLGEQSIELSGGGQDTALMFVGEWVEGYHEFHLSETGESPDSVTVLWDTESGYRELSSVQVREIHRLAAFILTYYHDTETFSEIFPWHHASGDFVASCSTDRTDVRLITVRQYGARIVFGNESHRGRAEALLAFLANLTIRMRLDRLDGVGRVAWAGSYCVEATVWGFLDAMKAKIAEGVCEPELFGEFLRIAGTIHPGDLAGIFSRVLEGYDPEAPDVPVIAEELPDHVFEVFRSLRDLSSVGV